ncbi:MAG: TFIIB-type zinc ribbon-containing protein [Christensenellaceae bacterium]|nr:TFIIB-type zinc ribbon-containing protein [Christensenellaceae bacterium]
MGKGLAALAKRPGEWQEKGRGTIVQSAAGNAARQCPNCGGAMEFNIAKQRIVCKNCNTELEMEAPAREVQEHAFSETAASAAQSQWDGATRVLACEACGAEITVAADVTSVRCRFCGSPKMVQSGHSAGIVPEGLMLFQFGRQEASAALSKWLKSRFFAPSAMKTLAQAGALSAVYSPFWTFDAQAQGDYIGEGGTTHTRAVTRNGKQETESYTVWSTVFGRVSKFFNDVLIYAGGSQGKLLSRLKDFDTVRGLIPFESAYLSGFQAETYTLSPEEALERAKEAMSSELERMARDEIRRSYDSERGTRVNASFFNVMCKHVLLPVWFSGFSYGGKAFGVVINGVTGKIAGAYPKSAGKIAAVVAAGLLLLAAIVWIVYANS